MQRPEIMEKQIKNSYYLKEYIFPSSKIIKIQGYEHFALDELTQKENISEEDIVTGCKNVPTIWYNDSNNKKRRHFVDIFIPTKNKCIEVKSTWTFTKQKDIIFLKQSAAKELGYLYEIWVYDNKGNKVEFYN
jgi:DNA repair protein RadC